MPKVLNKRTDDIHEDAVYVGRPSEWGNPFREGYDSSGTYWSRNDVVNLFESWIEQEIRDGRISLNKLRDKDLVCWCAPKRCHADILLKLANSSDVDV